MSARDGDPLSVNSDPNSFTTQRLQHASPEHLHITSQRLFIGPLPKGWLRVHRKSWYKSFLGLNNYTSRTQTFSAESNASASHTRQSTLAATRETWYRQSFRQPQDVEDGENEQDEPQADSDTRENAQNAQGPSLAGDGVQDTAQVRDITQDISKLSGLTLRKCPTDHSLDLYYDAPQSPKSNLDAVSNNHLGQHPSTPSRVESSAPSAGVRGGQTEDSTVDLLQPASPRPAKSLKYSDSHKRDRASSLRFEENVDSNNGTEADNAASVHDQEISGERRRRHRYFRRRRHAVQGEIVRWERMLVRIDTTRQDLPVDYDENQSVKIETRVFRKWREFYVVCRRGFDSHAPYTLHLYSKRSIPVVQGTDLKHHSFSHEIPLRLKHTNVNLFSALDKSLVIWHPHKSGSKIYIMRARSPAHSVEWYTFIREALGWSRPQQFLVHVPDLEVVLCLDRPFAARTQNNENGNGDQAVLGVTDICINALRKSPEWASLLDSRFGLGSMGLTWRRYDRLEWVRDIDEKKLYGAMAMKTSHQLELRPRQHYPTCVDKDDGTMNEPVPVEGFLILLTSKKGDHQRMGRAYSRRLYFSTHNRFLCFCQPVQACPPRPPGLPTISGRRIPSTRRIYNETQHIFYVEPFPLKDGEIPWLRSNRRQFLSFHDKEVFQEARRNTFNLSNTEGYFDLCSVSQAREAVDNPRTSAHTFELVMKNGLVAQFRTYDQETRDAWIERLNQLVLYWEARTQEDISTLRAVREQNLRNLNIDEIQESWVGQFAQKWEVSRAYASTELFHVCNLLACRAVRMDGQLYCKPFRNTTFERYNALLTEGKLILFESVVRSHRNAAVPHTFVERKREISLRDCYVYSGLITDHDLLYHNTGFDSHTARPQVAPRIYLDDGWTSSDEDTARSFVIWINTRKTIFRESTEIGPAAAGSADGDGSERNNGWQRWRRVAALGTPGLSVVFKARSRAERDKWVLALETEIDRWQQEEDFRLVGNDHVGDSGG